MLAEAASLTASLLGNEVQEQAAKQLKKKVLIVLALVAIDIVVDNTFILVILLGGSSVQWVELIIYYAIYIPLIGCILGILLENLRVAKLYENEWSKDDVQPQVSELKYKTRAGTYLIIFLSICLMIIGKIFVTNAYSDYLEKKKGYTVAKGQEDASLFAIFTIDVSLPLILVVWWIFVKYFITPIHFVLDPEI